MAAKMPTRTAARELVRSGRRVIHHGDCLDVMAAMEPESVDAIAEARLNGTQRGLGLTG